MLKCLIIESHMCVCVCVCVCVSLSISLSLLFNLSRPAKRSLPLCILLLLPPACVHSPHSSYHWGVIITDACCPLALWITNIPSAAPAPQGRKPRVYIHAPAPATAMATRTICPSDHGPHETCSKTGFTHTHARTHTHTHTNTYGYTHTHTRL